MKPSDVHALLHDRKKHDAPAIARAIEVRDVYNGDMVVPLPELNTNERVAVANLLQQAIDQTGMRIASVMPEMIWPALRPGIKASEKKARDRRNVAISWHDTNTMELKLRRRARYLLGYGRAPVWIRPGTEGTPTWHLRDPLGSYPAPCLDPDQIVPPDAIFTFKRGREWLVKNYPQQMTQLRTHESSRTFEVVEYVDDRQCLTYVVGDIDPGSNSYGYSGGTDYSILHDYDNRAGVPLVVDPARITLDRRLGAYDGMVGMYQLQAKMQALSVIGMQRGIFPETWFIAGQSGGKIIKRADPFHGVIGEAEMGTITNVQMQPSFMGQQVIDRMAGEQRIDGGMPAEYSGLSSTNVRTGQRGAMVMSAAIDFFIQEAQVLFERSLEAENMIAVATQKAYAGNHTYSLYVKGIGKLVYTPNDTFETDIHEVKYPYAGADANGQEIRDGQKLGLETISRRTVMEHDPAIRDVEQELARISSEGLRKSFLNMLDQMVQDPNSPLLGSDIAQIYQGLASGVDEPWDVYQKVHEAAQARQAPSPDMAGMQPGLDAPAGARPELAGGVAAPSSSLANLSSLFQKTRVPQKALPAERAPVAAAGGGL